MRKAPPAASPDAYVAALTGWRQALVKKLRAAIRKAKPQDEQIKWGNIVYFTNGPLAVIRAEETRVLFGFWRGRRLVDLEAKLKPGGKYEMATMEIRGGEPVSPAKVTRLMKAAIALNKTLGDPTQSAPARETSQSAPARETSQSAPARETSQSAPARGTASKRPKKKVPASR